MLDASRQRIAIFGSTGSVGKQALEIVAQYPQRLYPVALTGYDEVEEMLHQVSLFAPEVVVLVDESAGKCLQEKLRGQTVQVLVGPQALAQVIIDYDFALLLNAIVGAAGMLSTYLAIEHGRRVALANKESLVVGGSIIMPLAKQRNISLLPVDSEHSALFQCLQRTGQVDRLLLTASGGPFWQLSPQEIASVKAADALRHPNWKMGPKITIDSASFMNKGLEVIEAHWLFGIGYERIAAYIHPESIIHSMVEYSDGSVIAQMALPDMRLPIAYALFFPEAIELGYPRLDFNSLQNLRFTAIPHEKFSCYTLALQAGRHGGCMPAVLNGANEIAVAAFLEGRVSFLDIPRIVAETMAACQLAVPGDIHGFVQVDAWARQQARQLIKKI